MSVVIETTLGDVTVDLYIEQRPTTCLNFLKLCKMKYYNYNLFHTIRSGFIAQTGDPTGEGSGGKSIWGILEGDDKRFFSGERRPKIRHADVGLLSMVCTGEAMVGSQFFFTLGPDLDSLDDVHIVIGEVTEGHEVLRKLNDAICDETHRPYQDVRITHTVVLDDPFSDPNGLRAPSRSPSPSAERLKGGRIAPDEELNETEGKSAHELQEMIEEKEAKARATILEIVGDLPDADIAPPENVLFVCKLNPVTSDEDLEIIFSRFGKIVTCEVIRDKKTGDSLQYAFIEFADKKSCEDAYFKMDNVLIDDRRIHVDFSQSVSKIKWLGKGRGVKHFSDEDIRNNKSRRDFSGISQSSEHNRNNFRENRERHSETDRKRRTEKNRDWEERNREQGNKERIREKEERKDREDQDKARKSVREDRYKDRQNENKNKDRKQERIEMKREKEDENKDTERKRNREERNRPREDENKEKDRKRDREHRNTDREDENKDKDRKRIREERNDKEDRNDSRQSKELTKAPQRISRSRSANRTRSPVKENKSRDKNQSPNKEIKERENRRSFKDTNERGSHRSGVKDKRASADKEIKERNIRSPPHQTRERERTSRNRQQNEEIRKNKITDSPDREKRHKESFERHQEQFNVAIKERNRSMSPGREKCISGRKVDRLTVKNPSKYPQDNRDDKYDYKNTEKINENYKNGRDRDHTDRPKDRKRSDSGNNMNGKLGDRDSAVKKKRQHEVSDNILQQNNDRKTEAEKEKRTESAALREKSKKTMIDRKDQRSKILKKTKIVKKRKHSTSSSSVSSTSSSDSSSSESDHKRKKSSKNSKKRKYSTSDSSSSTSSSSSSSSSSSDSSSDSSTSSSDSEPKHKSNAKKKTAKKSKIIKKVK